MLSRNYFDAGNQINGTDARGKPYEVVTLAALSGLKNHWVKFDAGWKGVTTKYKVKWLHTTDAVGLSGSYGKSNGWDVDKRDKFINDCVTVIERNAAKSRVRIGIRPVSVTIWLTDFKKALKDNPDLDNPAHVCAVQATATCLQYGDLIGAKEFELYFDRNEPFYGHIYDRWSNKRARATEGIWKRVSHVCQAECLKVPALQAADLLAWSINHAEEERTVRFDWQQRILDIEREPDIFDYDRLRKEVLTESVERMKQYKMPKRRRYR